MVGRGLVRNVAEEEASHHRAGAVASLEPRRLTTQESLAAGGVAGAVAKTVIAPADRIKILYQVNSARVFTWRSAFRSGRRIIEHEGVPGLWRGNGATMMRVIPYSAVTYFSYDHFHRGLGSSVSDRPVLRRFVAGSLAGASAVTLTYPLDLLRARMAAHWGPGAAHNSCLKVVSRIVREEGVLALYSGIVPTIVGVVPYAGTSFMVFETFKARMRRYYDLKHDREIPTVARLVAGGVAGLIAQSATYPIDILRRRMQVGVLRGLSMPSAFAHIYAVEGLRGLYKGLSMNWFKGPVSVGVSFTINDAVKSWISRQHSDSLPLSPSTA